mmetsp:Transcript_7706/g.16942  ORF Transcript_7706/g.16942 Transcript_7706/m.16942 type:complete len:324 (+) Transcript_7706:54-1025(+)
MCEEIEAQAQAQDYDAGSGMAALGIEEMQETHGVDDLTACGVDETCAATSSISGVLHVLSTVSDSLEERWLPCYAILERCTLAWYQDETLSELRGNASLSSASVVHSFADEGSPWHASALSREHPHGFVVDVDSYLPEEQKILIHFDALNAEEVIRWLVALQATISDSSLAPELHHVDNPESDGQEAIAQAETIEIDDFSDYDEDGNLQMRQSSFSNKYGADWGAEVEAPGEQQSFEIDDFSDYEDDGIARKSSLAMMAHSDWVKISQLDGQRARRSLPPLSTRLLEEEDELLSAPRPYVKNLLPVMLERAKTCPADTSYVAS